MINLSVSNIVDSVKNFLPWGDSGKSDVMAYAGQNTTANSVSSIFDGSKFFGGFGLTELQQIDYWTLRTRSAQLYNDNPYARGIVRRFVTNVINTGLTPEIMPDENILGFPESSLDEWSENVEARFNIWYKNPRLCDWKQQNTFGKIQRIAYLEALVAGDVLVVLRQSPENGLPLVQLINGGKVRSPLGSQQQINTTNRIIEGVELDGNNRTVAYWVDQDDGTSKRLPAFIRRGQKVAWLVFGTDKRLDDVRGQPILALILQSLKEIDRYKDAAQRKAVINSMLAMFIKKGDDKPGTLPITNAAERRGTVSLDDGAGSPRTFSAAQWDPGVVIEELQTGEEPIAFGSQGTDLNFGAFEESIVQGMSWALELPPEILRLTFSSNYSASQAAINEFKIKINELWSDWGETFCTPIEQRWLISEVLLGKIQADGLIDSWRDPNQYDVFGAWMSVEWYGSIKPSTDSYKQARGSELLIDEYLTSRTRESRVTTGTKFTTNVKRQKRENELIAEAEVAKLRPMLELKREFGDAAVDTAVTRTQTNSTEIIETVED